MLIDLNLRIVLLSIATALSVVTIVYSWIKGKKNATLNSFLYFQTILLIWLVAQIFRYFDANTPAEWLDVRIEYFAICYIGLSWLFFCLRYTERKFLNSPINMVLLCIIPTVCYISVLTNQYHHLFFSKYDRNFNTPEFLFWIHTCETYCYCLIGTFLLIGYSFKQFGHKKRQIILLVAAAFIPIITNLLLISGLFDPDFDITPLSFSMPLLLFAVAMFKHKMLNNEPIALRKIVDNLKEPILVIDNFNQIEDFNHAFSEYLPLKIGDPIHTLANHLLENIENCAESQRIVRAITDNKIMHTSGELNLIKSDKRCFHVSIQPIINGRELIGRVISFNDITGDKNLQEELHAKNTELLTKNLQLEQYAATIAKLAVAKERNRFARDVHDTLGQTMTLLITLLQITKMNCRNDLDMAETRLDEALKIAGDGLAEVRRSLISMVPEHTTSLKKALQGLVEDFRMTGMKIDLSIGELGQYDDFIHSGVIYRVCQEALTNSLRHGKANHVMITLALDEQRMFLAITDDGNGCEDLNKGFGLNGMEQRIIRLKGDIIYNHGKAGFGILVEIPLIS